MGSNPFKVTHLRRQSSSATTSTNTDTTFTSIPSDSTNSQTMSISTSPSTSSPVSTASSSDSSSPLGSSSSQADKSSSSMPSSDPSSSNASSSQAPTSSATQSTTSSSSSSTIPNSSTSSAPATSSSSSTTDSSTSSSTSSSTTDSASTTTSTPTSTSTSTTTSTPISTSISTSASTPTSTSTSTSTSTPTSASTHTSSSSNDQPTSTTSVFTTPLTTITTSVLTTINGQPTTQKVVTAIPTSLNSAPSIHTSEPRGGIIAGSVIAASLLTLLALSGIVVYYRHRSKRKNALLAYRSLPRSALLADEDAIDLAASPSRLSAAPILLRPRGMETGSIFHEGVWPPPGERSRLEDPLLAGSTVDLSTIVDDVMGGHGAEHGRSISAYTTQSDVPLLENMSPEQGGDAPASYAATPPASSRVPSQPAGTPQPRLAITSDPSEPSETTPMNPSEHHERQLSDDAPYPAPGPPAASSARLDMARGQSTRSAASTTGSLSYDFPSGLGSLVVVNNSSPEMDNPLVDLTPIPEIPVPDDPPLYHSADHTIQRGAPNP